MTEDNQSAVYNKALNAVFSILEMALNQKQINDYVYIGSSHIIKVRKKEQMNLEKQDDRPAKSLR